MNDKLRDEVKGTLWWIGHEDYGLGGPFSDGSYGITRRDMGGKWQSVSDEVLSAMVLRGLLREVNNCGKRFVVTWFGKQIAAVVRHDVISLSVHPDFKRLLKEGIL